MTMTQQRQRDLETVQKSLWDAGFWAAGGPLMTGQRSLVVKAREGMNAALRAALGDAWTSKRVGNGNVAIFWRP